MSDSKDCTEHELFRLFVENMLEGVVIVDWDTTILFANKVAATLLGFDSVEEFIGRKSLEFVHPDSKELLLKNLQTIKSGENKVNNEYQFTTNKGKNVWFQTCGTKIHFRDRSADLVTFNDITERKRAEEELQKSEIQYRTLVERSLQGIVIAQGMPPHLVFTNTAFAEITGYTLEELYSFSLEDVKTLVHPEDQPTVFKRYADRLAGNTAPSRYEFRIIRKDGEMRWLEILASRIEYQGEPAVQGAFMDITERKQVEEQIKASLREKEVLLKEIHHRVKNNMQIISSLLSLQSHSIADPELLDMFKDSQTRIKSMALVHEKLYQSEDFSNINFKEYINVLAAHVIQSYGAHAGTVVLTVDAEDISLGIDAAIPCGLIINELVSNAVKHAFPDGRGEIKITFHAVDGTIELIVADNGVGIPEDIDIRTTESLGLSLVTLLAEEQLNGTIDVERGKGTAFRITFKRMK